MIKVITCTKCKNLNEFAYRPIYRSLLRLATFNNISWIDSIEWDSKDGMPIAYNKFITEENRNDILLFVHDDVVLEDIFLAEKLNNSPYKVTGLAGATSYNKSDTHAMWHTAAPRSDLRGEVAHIKDGVVWTTVFGPTQSRVLTLDGLFIAAKCSALLDANVRFDEDPLFRYHFYDLSFSLRCHEAKISAGVLPIRVVHHGLGDSCQSEEWRKGRERFKELYCS